MAYVAVKGGLAAIEASLERLKYERLKGRTVVEVETIKHTLRGMIDRIMSEGSLYSRDLAALAVKQGEGNPEEATFLLRAYRSTLPRKYYSQVIDTRNMLLKRRISAAFKDIPGGQILGASYDYTHRLLDFSLWEEKLPDVEKWLGEFENNTAAEKENSNGYACSLVKVVDFLRKEGLLAMIAEDNTEPLDVTRKSLVFPADRSERLQTLTRGETGAVTALGYAAIRGYGILHPTVGELRVGEVPVFVNYPLEENQSEEDAVYIGEIQVTEVETLFPQTRKKEGGENELEFFLGYGLCFGQNETKAIAMSVLDYCLEKGPKDTPVSDEEFVLMHIDSVEATGFVSHLKLPHYVTFQSKLDRVRSTKRKGGEGK